MAKEMKYYLDKAMPAVDAFGTILSAYGKKRSGESSKRAYYREAANIEQNAMQRIAQAQREAQNVEREGRLAESRALAIAAASGGASDPGVINLIAKMAGENNYNRMVALYGGQEEARQMRLEAQARREQGDSDAEAGNLGALSTVVSGFSSLYKNYWAGDKNG